MPCPRTIFAAGFARRSVMPALVGRGVGNATEVTDKARGRSPTAVPPRHAFAPPEGQNARTTESAAS